MERPADLAKRVPPSRALVLKPCASESPGGLVRTEIAGPYLRVSDSAGLG